MSPKTASSAARSAKRSVKSTVKVDKTTTKKDVITFESDDNIAEEIPSSEASAVSDNEPSSESEASDAKETPSTINESINDAVEELTDHHSLKEVARGYTPLHHPYGDFIFQSRLPPTSYALPSYDWDIRFISRLHDTLNEFD